MKRIRLLLLRLVSDFVSNVEFESSVKVVSSASFAESLNLTFQGQGRQQENEENSLKSVALNADSP